MHRAMFHRRSVKRLCRKCSEEYSTNWNRSTSNLGLQRMMSRSVETWRLPAGDALFYAMKDSTVRTAGLLRAQKPTVLDKIREAMRTELVKYTRGEIVELPMPALIVSAIKP